MKLRTLWFLAVLLVLAMIGSAIVWSWYRDRQRNVAVDALIVELAESGDRTERQASSLPEVPERPARGDIEREIGLIVTRMRETSDQAADLRRRAEEIIPWASYKKREALRDALARYVFRLGQALDRYTRRADELREKAKSLQPAPG